VEDVLTGEVHIAAAWDPIAGYFVKTKSVGASLSLLPLADDPPLR
jgi:hypothetical protein